MYTCTFFGHKDTPEAVSDSLKKAIVNLIEQENVTRFYVGNQGKFDAMVASRLKELKNIYPHISFAIVIAYLPTKKEKMHCDYSDTLFPEGLEKTPPRFAIDKRNEWMLQQSDYVISYVEHKTGGAAKFTGQAIKKGKKVINLASST